MLLERTAATPMLVVTQPTVPLVATAVTAAELVAIYQQAYALALTVRAAMAATVVQAETAPVSQRPDLVRLHARVL
jgi:hypothetical protein